ncbi:MAG: hypothetical protein JWL77_2057 [Chthonomonadaceae bacterium]|nr:hypothetical protein [Chthonomonadaceae bacterium]
MAGRMQSAYPPPAPTRRQGNNGLLLWSLIGCGVIALLVVVIVGVMATSYMKKPGSKGLFGVAGVVSTMTSAAENVEKVGAGLEDYRKDHNGKYPANLDALVPKYVPDKSIFVCGSSDDPKPMEYTAPKPDAADSVVVVRVHVGDIVMPNQRQQMYVCLLKSGEVDSEQQARTVLSKSHRQAATP